MKYLSLDNPIKLNQKYKNHLILYQCSAIFSNGILLTVLENSSPASRAKPGDEIFYHNNDHGFWSGLREYVPPPVKGKVFIILWRIGVKFFTVSNDTLLEDAEYYMNLGWVPVEGFEVEYDVPQTGG